jgi:hypothetical protein
MRAHLLMLAVIAALTLACGDDDSPTEPTSEDSTQAATSITYSGTLAVGGSRFYSFTNNTAGSVTAFLASVTSTDTRLPVAAPLEIAIGVPAGTDCPPTTSQILSPSLTSQMTVSLAAGIFCLRVSDAGQMKAPVDFAVRFAHP